MHGARFLGAGAAIPPHIGGIGLLIWGSLYCMQISKHNISVPLFVKQLRHPVSLMSSPRRPSLMA
jgi:hypothetical protein